LRNFELLLLLAPLSTRRDYEAGKRLTANQSPTANDNAVTT